MNILTDIGEWLKKKSVRYCPKVLLAKALTLGRCNYLFAGSYEAAQRIVMFYSFFGTGASNKVNPYTWLKTLLGIISDYLIDSIEEMMPINKKLFSPM